METTKPYKIILADDHILLRDALAGLIDNFEQFSVVGRAANGAEVIELMEYGRQTDILLMDLNMPKMDGYETAKWMAAHHPQIKVVILTMYDSEIALIRLLQLGISGYINKNIHPEELSEVLGKIAAGENYYSNQASGKIVSHFRKKPGINLAFEKLVLEERDIEFIKLTCTEMSYKEIALQMNLTLKYIDNYRIRIYEKLQVASRVELVVYAIKNGIVAI